MTVDTTALTAPIDRAELKAFTRKNRTTDVPAAAVFGSVAAALAGMFIVFAGATILIALGSGSIRSGSPADLWPFLLALGACAGGVTLALRTMQSRRERVFRIAMFAHANGLAYEGKIHDRDLPGLIFRRGNSRAADPVVRGERGRFVEFANYRYATGSGKNRTVHRWGYVAIKLDVPLPHIVLDALAGNGLLGGTNLPVGFDRDQRLSLEGDFDRHFALYCPAGYERDALYLFTPDIMARFIDNAAALDVEIVDDWLFLYAKRDLVTSDAATWTWLMTTVDAVTQKLDQWARWRDDRLATASVAAAGDTAPSTVRPPGVAAGGRRLRRGVPWAAIALTGVVVVGWWMLQSGAFGLFLH